MNHSALFAVVRRQCVIVSRDSRLRMLSAIFLLACVAAFASSIARNASLSTEADLARIDDARAWADQGSVNPHSASHFGRYVFKTPPVLSAFDPGVFDYAGTLVRLESHQQSVASGRPGNAGTTLSGFTPLSAASLLQVLAPLLIILLGFGAFSGRQARTLLEQELGTGVSPYTLLLGQLLALGAVVVTVLALFALAAVPGLISARSDGEQFTRLFLMLGGYTLYLLTFLAITLGVSALCHSARRSLTTLVAIWVCSILLIPRVAPAVAANIHPAPSVQQFHTEVNAAVDAVMDDGGNRDDRPQRLREMVMERFDVDDIDDLPVNHTGVVLEYSEDVSTDVYRRHFADLYDIYDRQLALQRWFSVASPLIALKPWSSALAGSDVAAHRAFLSDAEDYRYRYVQALNRDIAINRPHTQAEYVADVAQITSVVGEFQASALPLSAVAQRQWPDILVLGGWGTASLAFALWCAGRLRRAV